MIVYYISKISDNLNTYPFPIKEGDICMLHEGNLVKTVFIDSKVEEDSIFRDFRFVDTKSLKSYRFPYMDTILCAHYKKGKAKGDKSLASLLLSDCTGEWLTDFLNDTLAILEGKREYWDLTVLRRLMGEEDINIAFKTPIVESFTNKITKLIYLPDTENFAFHKEEIGLSIGDYCFCYTTNRIALIQIDKEFDAINSISDFRLIESINEPEIMLPLGVTILYDNAGIRKDKFLYRFDSIVKQPVSKSILFCALNDLPLSEDEDVKDYLDGKDESDNFSENKHLSSLFLEIIGIFEKKIEQRNYSILKDLVNGVPRSEVAKKNNLTQERIRQLYKKILEEVKAFLISDMQENEKLHKYIAQLKVQTQLYIEEIERLRNVVKNESLKENTNQSIEVTQLVAELLSTPIENLQLPVRAINVLNALNVPTFGEIPKIDKGILLKTKNCGKKTIYDIEKLIEKFGLKFGMTYSEIINKLDSIDSNVLRKQ